MNIMTIIPWLKSHWKIAVNAFVGLCVALLLGWGTILNNQNKKLSEALEMALNNIEAYLDSANGSLLALTVLKLDMKELQYQNDSILKELDKVRAKNGIKSKHLTTAATQTLIINVNGGKGVELNIIEVLKDTVYTDSILYNPLTKVYYSIGKDSVNIALDVNNTQYLYIFRSKEYVHKKNFFKRLITFDFKKTTKYKYSIVNTNDLVDTKDVRVIEAISK